MRRIKIVLWVLIAIAIAFGIAGAAFAATNIDATDHWAWNDIIGWIDFYTPGTAYVWGTRLEGYASSSVGEISFDCATSPAGNICGTSNYVVCNGAWTGSSCNADAEGSLSGYAWNDEIGWISFRGTSPAYGVTILPNGEFSGYAWNDVVGWISFSGASPAYKVKTSWTSTSSVAYLESAVFDTQAQGGGVLNSITWYGNPTANGLVTENTYVGFQVAFSNCENGATNPPACNTGSWTFVGPAANPTSFYTEPCSVAGFRGGAGSTLASGNVGKPICVDPAQVSGYRYLRYRVQLRSNKLQNETPRIDRIILNWSR